MKEQYRQAMRSYRSNCEKNYSPRYRNNLITGLVLFNWFGWHMPMPSISVVRTKTYNKLVYGPAGKLP